MSPDARIDPKGLRAFEVTDRREDIRLVSPATQVLLFTNRDISSFGAKLLRVYDLFLELCPPDRLKWYRTENTQHKALTPRALDLLREWLKPGAKRREIICVEVRDGEDPGDTADWSFFVYGSEPGDTSHGDDANLIRLCFPSSWGAEKPEAVEALAVEVAELVPFQSGLAGFVLQTTEAEEEKSFKTAHALGMRYRALDIQNEIGDVTGVGQEGLKGVGWLTFLGDAFAKKAGGAAGLRKNLPKAVEVRVIKGGLLLKAGPRPILGDVKRAKDLGPYRAVYQALSKLQEPVMERYGAFNLPGEDASERTDQWLRRLAGK